MSKPSILNIDFKWNFEKSVLNAFSLALLSLINEKDLPLTENKLNRKLFKLVKIKSHREIWDVHPESNNLPDLDFDDIQERENKRPDFTCSFKDPLEENPLKNTKTFIVECKRLGNALINNQRLNILYSKNGIDRFINKSHGYGQGNTVGAMIGYVQSLEFDQILFEINTQNLENQVDFIRTDDGGWQRNSVSLLYHDIERPQVPPSPFRLYHLWADLR